MPVMGPDGTDGTFKPVLFFTSVLTLSLALSTSLFTGVVGTDTGNMVAGGAIGAGIWPFSLLFRNGAPDKMKLRTLMSLKFRYSFGVLRWSIVVFDWLTPDMEFCAELKSEACGFKSGAGFDLHLLARASGLRPIPQGGGSRA